jgi:hypothetical protein
MREGGRREKKKVRGSEGGERMRAGRLNEKN